MVAEVFHRSMSYMGPQFLSVPVAWYKSDPGVWQPGFGSAPVVVGAHVLTTAFAASIVGLDIDRFAYSSDLRRLFHYLYHSSDGTSAATGKTYWIEGTDTGNSDHWALKLVVNLHTDSPTSSRKFYFFPYFYPSYQPGGADGDPVLPSFNYVNLRQPPAVALSRPVGAVTPGGSE